MSELPDAVAVNAWTGKEAAHGQLAADAERWGSRRGSVPHSQASLPMVAEADPRDWSHPDVGYGILLPDDPELDPAAKATAADAPEPIRTLVDARPGTVVLRWSVIQGDTFVRRCYSDGTEQDRTIGLTPIGVARGCLPRYVLIVGGPTEIPWSVQYALSTHHAVGRLPLVGAALENYVDALLNGWAEADLDARAPLIWTVDGIDKITTLMRRAIADPLAKELEDPRLPRLRHLPGTDATGTGLLTALAQTRPALLVTSGHGSTPVGTDRLATDLGLPVDVAHRVIDLDAMDAAVPPGTIWYAQACCSAGSNAPSPYVGLLDPSWSVTATVAAIAELGSIVAPAALRLLGRDRPVRAVVGHVEPTFDWTLRVAETGQLLGHQIARALSSRLIVDRDPIGHAFRDYKSGVGALHTAWWSARGRLEAGDTSQRETLTRLRVAAIDRQSVVVLGDPTVTHPLLDGAP